MSDWNKNQKEEREIDLWRFVEVLMKRIWIIVLAAVVLGSAGFIYTKTCVPKVYRVTFSAYVNNRLNADAVTGSQDTTNTGDLNASIGLMYLYGEIINSRSLMEKVKENYDFANSASGLARMVSVSMPEKAALIKIKVTSEDPKLAYNLAVAMTKVAPEHIASIVDGSSMRIVDTPLMPKGPIAPNPTRNAILAALLGGALCYALFVIMEFVNDRVKDGEDLEKRYDVVVVGRIPDMAQVSKSSRYYKYRYSYRRHNYGKGYGDSR